MIRIFPQSFYSIDVQLGVVNIGNELFLKLCCL